MKKLMHKPVKASVFFVTLFSSFLIEMDLLCESEQVMSTSIWQWGQILRVALSVIESFDVISAKSINQSQSDQARRSDTFVSLPQAIVR
jgi:hypothetical protein